MYSNTNYSGKYWAVFGSKLSRLTEQPGYRVSDYGVPDYWGKTLFGKVDVWVRVWKAVFSNSTKFFTSLIKSIRSAFWGTDEVVKKNSSGDYFKLSI